MISVYREIKGQISTYLLENYDSAPAKTWVKMKILFVHAAVSPPPVKMDKDKAALLAEEEL